MSEEKEYGLEENFERLDEVLETLEQEDISLEDAFKAYSLGMEILKQCNDQIDKVEKQVQILGASGEPEEWDHGETEI